MANEKRSADRKANGEVYRDNFSAPEARPQLERVRAEYIEKKRRAKALKAPTSSESDRKPLAR